MKKLYKIIELIEQFASPELAQFDYVGLLLGDPSQPIKKVGLTLDCCTKAIEQAIKLNCDLLITHHGPTQIRYPIYGNRLDQFAMAKNHNLSLYRAHLNLDFCEEGIIDNLCKLLKIPAKKTLLRYGESTILGGVNLVNHYPMTFEQLKMRVLALGIDKIRVAGKLRENFSRIAVTSGQGFFGEFMDQLKPEVYIAGEFEQEATKYAEDLGIMLVELGHHASEARVLEVLQYKLSELLNLPVQFIEIPDTIQTIKIEERI